MAILFGEAIITIMQSLFVANDSVFHRLASSCSMKRIYILQVRPQCRFQGISNEFLYVISIYSVAPYFFFKGCTSLKKKKDMQEENLQFMVNCFKDNFSVLENMIIPFINREIRKFSIRGKYQDFCMYRHAHFPFCFQMQITEKKDVSVLQKLRAQIF